MHDPLHSSQPCGCDPGESYICAEHEVSATWGGTIPTVPVSHLGITIDARARKNAPLVTGCLDYFPLALLEVARLSKVGNDQHNPGEPLHWDKSKSTDEADALARHLLERGTFDVDGQRHSAKVAWRALALLQRELESEGGTR